MNNKRSYVTTMKDIAFERNSNHKKDGIFKKNYQPHQGWL